jgi:succinate dehydrogenase / fumarate reductase, membrane anchor subunit
MAQIASKERLPQAPAEPMGITFWPWFLQRVTGAGLIVLLLIHVVVNHYLNISEAEKGILPGLVVFSNVAERFESAGYWTSDILLLSFVLYHGLNGIRNIALDYGARGAVERTVTAVLLAIGAAAFVFGIFALAAFID